MIKYFFNGLVILILLSAASTVKATSCRDDFGKFKERSNLILYDYFHNSDKVFTAEIIYQIELDNPNLGLVDTEYFTLLSPKFYYKGENSSNTIQTLVDQKLEGNVLVFGNVQEDTLMNQRYLVNFYILNNSCIGNGIYSIESESDANVQKTVGFSKLPKPVQSLINSSIPILFYPYMAFSFVQLLFFQYPMIIFVTGLVIGLLGLIWYYTKKKHLTQK